MTVRRSGRWFLLLPLLLAAVGCGPGVGGTGTGEGYALEFFGARAASVCTAPFASELKCPSRIVIGPARVDVSQGSELVVWVDDPDSGRVAARIDGNTINFNAYCDDVHFEGTWGETKDGDSRFFGHYTVSGAGVAIPGTLVVQPRSDDFVLVLSDAQGGTVFGPIALQVSESGSAASSCQRQSVSLSPNVK